MERIDEALASVENPDVLSAILIKTGGVSRRGEFLSQAYLNPTRWLETQDTWPLDLR